MTTYLLAGGGTAGHVNPLLATAVALKEAEPDATLIVLGTKEGLESRLVPAAGFELITIPKVPFPRKPNLGAATFVFKFQAAVKQTKSIIRSRAVDVVIGFGGFAATPAYRAAKKLRIPIVIHEANAKPGLANRLGASYTSYVGVAALGTGLKHERLVGIPLRPEIINLDRASLREEALEYFRFQDEPVLLVTGGSQGAQRLNETISASIDDLLSTGYQILHLVGTNNELPPASARYRPVHYLDRMDYALSIANFAFARSGAMTVAEFSAIGLPAVYVPLPHGNGEQALNARHIVESGGALIVNNDDFTPEWVASVGVDLLSHPTRVKEMADIAYREGIRDGAKRLVDLILEAKQEKVSP